MKRMVSIDPPFAWPSRNEANDAPPLFGSLTLALFDEWTASGADAIIVTARAECLDESWLGRPLRAEMRAELARRGVDPCGERGEYHTAVTNSPLFSSPIDVVLGERVERSGCHALDLTLACSADLPVRPAAVLKVCTASDADR